jgi:hypothetical protein
MPSKLSWEKIRDAIAKMGGPGAATPVTTNVREGLEAAPEALAGLGQPELAQVDRAAQGGLAKRTLGKAAYLGLPAAAAYEGAKAVEQSPFRNFATRTLLDLAGGQINEKTSPASWDNVAAYYRGMAEPEESFTSPMGPPPTMLAGKGGPQRR